MARRHRTETPAVSRESAEANESTKGVHAMMAAYTVKSGTVDTIRLVAYEPHTHHIAAELVGDDGTIAAVVLEPEARADRRADWDEYQWREDVRQVLRELAYEGSEGYTLVWDPGRDQTEEEPL